MELCRCVRKTQNHRRRGSIASQWPQRPSIVFCKDAMCPSPSSPLPQSTKEAPLPHSPPWIRPCFCALSSYGNNLWLTSPPIPPTLEFSPGNLFALATLPSLMSHFTRVCPTCSVQIAASYSSPGSRPAPVFTLDAHPAPSTQTVAVVTTRSIIVISMTALAVVRIAGGQSRCSEMR